MIQTYQKGERIPADESGVFEGLDTAKKLALIRTDNMPRGIGGFLLDVVEEENIEVSTDITDHFTEQNISIQDHAALRPETVTLHGVISELSILRTQEEPNQYDRRRNSLPPREDLGPELTEGAKQSKASATPPERKKKTVLTTYADAYGAIGGQRGKKQRDVFSYLYQIWKGRQFVTVETAWGIWPCMMIQSLRTEQSKDSRFQSDFYVTFKAIRFASQIEKQAEGEGRADDQKQDTTNNGEGGKEEQESWLRKLIHTDD